jgi:hypothetical protein
MILRKILHISGALVLLFSGIFFNTGCTHEPTVIQELDTVCFETQVLPIFQISCAKSGCHSSTSSGEVFPLDNYDNIITRVVPGDPRNSEVYKAITSLYAEEFMPPDGPLDIIQRNLIQVWILQGANDTKCPVDTINLPNVPPPPPPSPIPALTTNQINKLTQWINEGVINSNFENLNCDNTGAISFQNQVSHPTINLNCVDFHTTGYANGNVNLSDINFVRKIADSTREGTSLIGTIQ